jgi:nucleoside-diphosphate-sugar epimerase
LHGLGNPDKKHTYTFIDDFGKALIVISHNDEALGCAWHVPNAAVIRTMGKGILRLGGLFIPAAREYIEMLYQFEHDFIVDSRQFSKRFGLVATPLETVLAKTLESQ